MKICIIGGGKVGFYLAKSLLEHGHEPVVIERQQRYCEKLADTLDIPVICGDGTTLEALEAAGCAGCAAFVAVSGNDETNLIACQLAKKVFGLPKTVARVNNPRNTEVLRRLGVDIPVSSTDNLGRLLEREVETDRIRQLLSMTDRIRQPYRDHHPAGFCLRRPGAGRAAHAAGRHHHLGDPGGRVLHPPRQHPPAGRGQGALPCQGHRLPYPDGGLGPGPVAFA